MATKKTTAKKTTRATAKTPVKKTAVSGKSTGKSTKTSALAGSSVSAKSALNNTAVKGGRRSFKIRKLYLGLGAALIALIAFVLLFPGLFVAAVVNGQPVSRVAVVKEAEKQSGKQALDSLVRNTLIEQEAAKNNVTVSDEEIDREIKTIEETLSKQNQKLDEVLSLQGMTRDDLRKLIRLDKLVGKLVGKDVKISAEEIDQYIEENQETLPAEQSEKEIRKSVEESLKQQKLSEDVQQWLSDLQEGAQVQRFVSY